MSTRVVIDHDLDALLDELVARSGKSRAQIVRDALIRLSAEQGAEPAAPTPYDLAADLLGVAHGGPTDLARRHKTALQELLKSGAVD